MNARNVVELDLAWARYGRTQVLGALRLSLSAGETVAIVGPSGIGKSTLLRIVAGLHGNFGGSRVVTGLTTMIFQEPQLLPWRTARDNIVLATGVSNTRADLALDEVGLAGLEGRFPASLSLGQQRRLSLARAFASDPDILLMDEPFVSLDAALADEMMNLFEALCKSRNIATMLVTHASAEADRLADRILRLSGSPATVSQ